MSSQPYFVGSYIFDICCDDLLVGCDEEKTLLANDTIYIIVLISRSVELLSYKVRYFSRWTGSGIFSTSVKVLLCNLINRLLLLQ